MPSRSCAEKLCIVSILATKSNKIIAVHKHCWLNRYSSIYSLGRNTSYDLAAWQSRDKALAPAKPDSSRPFLTPFSGADGASRYEEATRRINDTGGACSANRPPPATPPTTFCGPFVAKRFSPLYIPPPTCDYGRPGQRHAL